MSLEYWCEHNTRIMLPTPEEYYMFSDSYKGIIDFKNHKDVRPVKIPDGIIFCPICGKKRPAEDM